MYENQARANTQKQKADPPKFNGKSSEDLELWRFHIEEHFSAYAAERDAPDSRFVDMVVPFLGTEAMSWYRQFKTTLGESPRVDFDYKLLYKLYNLRVSGTQQDYTSKFMLFFSQSTIDMVKRWIYQQNLRSDTSCHISQNTPTTLHDAIMHAQRFEDARGTSRGDVKDLPSTSDKKRGKSGSEFTPRGATSKTNTTTPIVYHNCHQPSHIAPACPEPSRHSVQGCFYFIDGGASFNAVTPQLVEKLGLRVTNYITPVSIRIGGGKKLTIPQKVVRLKCLIPGFASYTTRALDISQYYSTHNYQSVYGATCVVSTRHLKALLRATDNEFCLFINANEPASKEDLAGKY
ncbi:hypothetical protein GN244_ATG14269 [Phytophthora infestans]|uniref:Retrotransposon gag domain-containing protein n=1 Tax=Phytophthora infestans TaxID=4787 RepID=A0A833T4T4_PHYIN|nr:hypothetical protein GN244_ATG14269 [Phytophthora infestans]